MTPLRQPNVQKKSSVDARFLGRFHAVHIVHNAENFSSCTKILLTFKMFAKVNF